MSMLLMPARRGTCDKCATEHGDRLAHNCDSLYYQMRFHAVHGRWPTWDDAAAHLSDADRRVFRAAFEQMTEWTTTPHPIAEPHAQSAGTVLTPMEQKEDLHRVEYLQEA